MCISRQDGSARDCTGTGMDPGSSKVSSRVGEGGVSLRWDFPSGGSGMCYGGNRDHHESPSLCLSSKGGKKMENPLNIHGKSLIFSAVLSCSAGDSSGMRTLGISLSCRIQGSCGIRRKTPPVRAPVMYPMVFSPAAQGSSSSQGKFPHPRHSQHLLPLGDLSCRVLVEL